MIQIKKTWQIRLSGCDDVINDVPLHLLSDNGDISNYKKGKNIRLISPVDIL